MKILFVIPYKPIPRIDKRIKALGSDKEITLIYLDRDGKESKPLNYAENVKVLRIKSRYGINNHLYRLLNILIFSQEVHKIIKSYNPDIIFTTKNDMLLSLRLRNLLFKIEAKIIYEVSDLHYLAFNNSKKLKDKFIKQIIYRAEKKSMEIVDKLVVTSMYFWNHYYKDFIDLNDVLYIPNTPDPEVFKKFNKRKNEKFTIAFIGKVRYIEQLKMLIAVSQSENIEVMIAGDGPELENIIEYTEQLSNVQVLGSYSYQEDIAKLYSKADAIYSVYDTNIDNVRIALPNRLYESAICGIPLIVSSGTYLSEVVEENGLGYSIPSDDPNALESVIKTMKNDNNRAKYIKNGKRFFSENNFQEASLKFDSLMENL